MILDCKLDFKSHIREVIVKARRGIGLIKYLSKHVSREVLDQVYKLYIRPHLDYGDIIYHRFDPEMHLEIIKKIGAGTIFSGFGSDWHMEGYK